MLTHCCASSRPLIQPRLRSYMSIRRSVRSANASLFAPSPAPPSSVPRGLFIRTSARKRCIIYGVSHRGCSTEEEAYNDLFAEGERGRQGGREGRRDPHGEKEVKTTEEEKPRPHPPRSQTFPLPFSGWLVLGILRRSRSTPLFILAHLSHRNRRVIVGRGKPREILFGLAHSALPRPRPPEPSRGSQVLTING
jgi:hypothetical protein